MEGSAASIGTSTASTAISHSCPSTAVEDEESSMEESAGTIGTVSTIFHSCHSDLSLSTEDEDEDEDEDDVENIPPGPWHHISPEESLKDYFNAWQEYGPVENWGPLEEESSIYEVSTDKGTFFIVKEFSFGSQGNGRLLWLEQKIESLKQLRHENIVRYIGTNEDNEKLYVFLEVMSNGSLSTVYREHSLINPQVSSYTRQILEGLNYLHGLQVIHRDIRCAKILVAARGTVKLDFGLANAINPNGADSFRGTIFWMAPEVVCNGRNGIYGSAADIWSLGCTVLEMFTRNRPYSEFGDGQVSDIILAGTLPIIPENLPREAKDFIYDCLRVNPQDRPSAVELLGHPFVRRPPN